MRLFWAILLEDTARQVLARQQACLRARALGKVAWVSPDNFHLTLHFLGETDPSCLPALIERMHKAIVPCFSMELVGLGRFPQGAIWAGFQAPPQLERLARSLGARRFHPHVTLGRCRGKVELELDPQLHLGRTRVTEFVLMRSQLRSQGALYTVEHRVRLD